MSVPHKCPVCLGTGVVSTPPGVAADQENFSSTESGPWPCGPCWGTGIIWSAGPAPCECRCKKQNDLYLPMRHTGGEE